MKELVEHVLQTSFETLGGETIERAKERVIDVIGCILSGSRADGSKAICDLVREWGGKKESSIFVYGGRVPACNAAFANSIMARSYDFEPVGTFVEGKERPSHISGSTIPTALAVGEMKGCSGKEILTAIVVGDDLASRILAASNFGLGFKWDSVGIVNAFGVVGTAGRLMALNSGTLRNAFGIVLNQLSGTFQNLYDAAHTFKLLQGLSAKAGILSVLLASKGLKGVDDPLFAERGYFSLYCDAYDQGLLKRDLGRRFYADSTIKPYPCCRATHGAIDCALSIVSENDIRPEEVEQIIVRVSPKTLAFAVGQPFVERGVPQINAAFSLQYAVACAVLRRSVKLEHFEEEAIRDERILSLVEKVILGSDGIPPEKHLACHMTMKVKDGRVFEKYVDVPKGDEFFNPLSREEKMEKFLENASFSRLMSREKAKELLGWLQDLESLTSLRRVVRLLSP